MAKSDPTPTEPTDESVDESVDESADHVEHSGEVGRSVEKVDGYGLVTGEAAYTDDMPTEHSLEGKILYSPHAHARIVSIDASAAENVDGVKAVLTHEDFPERRYSRQGVPHPQPAPYDERPIDEKVRFVGDVVAAVAAETEAAAEAALEAREMVRIETSRDDDLTATHCRAAMRFADSTHVASNPRRESAPSQSTSGPSRRWRTVTISATLYRHLDDRGYAGVGPALSRLSTNSQSKDNESMWARQ